MKLSPGSMPLIFLLFVMLIAVSTVSVTAGPGDTVHNLNKGTDYATIAAAVAAADDGDTIQVDSGIYLENNIEIMKSITLTGSGPTKPVINGQTYNGIIVSAPNVHISGINVTNCYYGITVSASGTQILGVNVSGCDRGIYVSASYNQIIGINVTSCNRGIYFHYGSDENEIRDTNVTGCSDTGIYLYYAGDNYLHNNNLTFNNIGLLFEYADYNTIVGNNVSGNTYRGIRFRNDGRYNEIYQNIFWNNAQDVDYNYNNYWNSRVQQSYQYHGVAFTNKTGNYWANYAGADSNGDGIGDTPKVVYYGDGSNVYDNYPMMLDLPVPPKASFTFNRTSDYAPFAVQFTDTSTKGPTSWHWEFGDGTTSDLQNPVHIYSMSGTYLVNLTATNAFGSNMARMASTGKSIQVLPPLPSPLKTIWLKTYPMSGITGANMYDVTEASDDGFALVGYTTGMNSGLRLIKADASGNQVWNQIYATYGLGSGSSLVPEDDGGFTFAGEDSTGVIGVTRTQADGSVAWTTTLANTNGVAPGIAHTGDGGYVVTGSRSFNRYFGSRDGYMWVPNVYVAKLYPNGNRDWENAYGALSTDLGWQIFHAPSAGYDVLQSDDGGYAVSGVLNPLGMSSRLYLLKTASSGSFAWNTTFGDDVVSHVGNAILQTGGGGYLVAGGTWTPDELTEIVELTMFSSGGTWLWNHTYAGYNYRSIGDSIISDGNGGYVIAGRTVTPDGVYRPYLIGVDGSGNPQWETVLNLSIYDHVSIATAGDDGFVVGGSLADGTGNNQAFMVKIGSVATVLPKVAFSAVSATADEGTTPHIMLHRTGDTSGESSVLVSNVGGTAVAGKNYTFIPVRITFEAGQADSGFDVQLPSNSIIEPADTYVNFSLSSPINANLGSQTKCNLTIHDTTPMPAIQFSAVTGSANESTTAHVTLSRTGAINTACSVDVTVTGGTASGSDYTMASATVSFSAGVATQTLDLDLTADHTTEGSETLVLGLSSPVGATIGTPAAFTLTINDTSRIADNTPPATSCALTGTIGLGGWYTSSVTVDLSASDTGGSGVANVSYRLDSGPWVTTSGSQVTFTISTNGIHTLLYNSTDVDGNHEVAKTITVKINKVFYPVAFQPANGTTGVSLNAQVRATFNTLIGLAPVTITLEDQEHRRVSGVVSKSGKVLTLTPRSPLASLTTYTATVSSTDESVPVAYSWSFTTMAPDEASIVTINGPDTLVLDEEHLQPFTLTVTVRNTGLDTWKSGNHLTFFNAYSSADYWNAENGTPKYPDQFHEWAFQLTSGPSSPIGPGQIATYTFTVTPTTGAYGNLSIGLWMRAANGNYFGDMAIYHPLVSRSALGATIVRIDGPQEMYYNPDPEHLYSDPDYNPAYALNITVKNTGEANWPLGYNLTFFDPLNDPSERNAYLDRPQSPDQFMDWAIVQTSAPSGLVRPGDNVTYRYLVYPESPRRSNWKIGFWMNDSYGNCFGNKSYFSSRLYSAMNDARVVSVTCQPQMLVEREYRITVQVENTGQMSWVRGYDLLCFDPATTDPWTSTFSRSAFKEWIVEPISAPHVKVNPGETGNYTFAVVPDREVLGKVELDFIMSDLVNNNFGEVVRAYTMINGSASAPLITAVSPANESEGVNIRTLIEVTFDRVMDTESLRSAFRVIDDSDTRIKGEISYDGRKATFTPAERLDYSRTYRVAVNGARDRYGNLAPGPYVWQFNTTDRAAVVQFHDASGFGEFGDTIHIVVDRTGDTAGTTSCVVSTQYAYTGFTFEPDLPVTLTFAPGETSKSIDFHTDAEFPTTMAIEFYIGLSDVKGGTLGQQQRFNITFPRTLISLVNDEVYPGQTGYVKVRRSGDVSGTSSCVLTLGSGTTAEAYRYVSLMPLTVTFGSGETEKEVAVINAVDRKSTSGDYYQPVIQVNASDEVGATILGAPYNSARLTLYDLDPGTRYRFIGSTITVNEGSELLVTLQRYNCNVSQHDSCNVYAISQTTYPDDYQANVPGQYTFEPGVTELPIIVYIGGDSESEGAEYIVLGIREEWSAQYKINIVDTSAGSMLQINGPDEGWEGETIPLLIMRSGRSYNLQSSCILSVVGGNASSPEDYTMQASSIVVFPAGDSGNEPSRKQTLNINLIHDGLATGDRTIVFKLTDTVNGMAIGGPFTFTIRDTDMCHIGFNTTQMDVGEGDIVRLNLTREGGDLSQSSSCVLSFKEGTVSPADYSSSVPLPATITFGPGEQNKLVDITLAADHATEGVEFAVFNLTGFNNAAPNKEEIKLEIRDRSVYPTHIYFYESTPLIYGTYLSVENGGRYMWEGETSHIRIVRTGDVSGTSSCVVSNVGGTADPREYQATLPTTITFGPGETEKTVDVTVLHTSYKNGISALSNYITLGLSNPVNTDLPIDGYTGRILNESYYLVDTDSQPYLGFSGTNVTTNEGSTVNLKVKLHYLGTNTYYKDFGLSKYNPCTADASDYTLNGPFTFASGATEVTVPVAIVADHVGEGDESLLLKIGSNSLATTFDNGYLINILDTSSDGTMPAVTATTPANNAIDVSPSAPGISATFNKYMDQATVRGGFILRDSMNRRVAGTVTYSDSTRTAIFSPNQSLASGASYTAYLTGIRDLDDNILVTYTWKFTTVQAPTPTILPAVVSTSPANGTSGVPLGAPVTITFNKTIVRASFQVYDSQELAVGGTTAIVGKVLTFTTDGPLDPVAEYHGIVEDAVDTDGYRMSGNFSFRFTTGAVPTIAFIAPAATANEGTTPHVMLYRSGDTSLEANVLVTDIGGTAVRGKNYTFMPVRITFEADQAYAGFDVGLPSNSISEQVDTYVNFSLSDPVNATLGDLVKFNLTVHDATKPVIVSTAPLNETTGCIAGIIPTVTFSKPIANVTFQLKDSSNSVISGTDLVDGAYYTYTPSTPLKYGERYRATVLDATDDGGRHLAAPYEFTFVTGPVPVLNFSASSGSVNEGSIYQLIVKRTGDLTGVSTCFVDGGSGSAGYADYSTSPSIPKSLTFGAGEAQKAINFTAFADNMTEGPESASFGISYVSGATRGTPYSFTLSISDTSVTPDTISFTKAGATVFAGATWQITVHRTGATNHPFSATIQVGGTAVEGRDYTVTPKQVDFTYLDDTNIFVTVSGNVTGLDKYVNFSLTNLTGASFSNQPTYNLTLAGTSYIPVIQFATASGLVEEGGSRIVTLTRTGLLSVESQVQVSATGTADGSDYTSYPSFGSFLTLYSGESSRNITIYGTQDYRTEGTETLTLSLIARGNSVIGPQSTFALTVNDTTTNFTKPIRNLHTWNLYTNLTKALSEAARGDTIEIDSGTYTVEALDINGTFLVGRDTGRGRPLIITSGQSELKDGGINGVDFDRSDVSAVYADSVLNVDGSSASVKNCNINSSATCIYHYGYLGDDDLRLTIENCTLIGGGRTSINYDIMGQGTGSTTIRNCTISGAGVRLWWAHNVTIDRCVLSGANLTLAGTDGNMIRDSRITGGEIQLLSTYMTVISNVTALRSPYSGLLVDSTNNLWVTGLAVYDSATGVRLVDIDRNVTIADSLIARADGDGLLLDNSEQLTLINTSVIDCATGVRLMAGSGNNTFYLNRFASVVNALQVNQSNKWSSYGPMTYQYSGRTYSGNCGNEWNNYPGSDANGDGIGDTPYLSGTIRDSYPLVSRSAISFEDNGPAVISVSWGFNGQNDFRVSDSIRVDLDRDIAGSALPGVSIRDSGNQQVPCDISYRKYFYGNEWSYYIYFEPQSDLGYGQTYTLTVSGLVDVRGRRMATPYVVTFTTETNAFQVLKVSPHDGASDWPSGWGEFVYNPIMVTFNRYLENIDNADLTAGKIRLLDESLTPVEITAYGSGSSFLDIRPKWNLKNATVYTIRINGIQDDKGNVLPGVFESRFVTWGNPEVVATLPKDKATDVPVNQPVFVYFDKVLNPGTINGISIKDSNGNKVSTSVGYIPAGSGKGDGSVSSVIIGHNNFSYSADYTIEVTGVADMSGNTMKYVDRKTFRTTDRPYIGSVSPAGGAIDVLRDTKITATFSKDMNLASLQGGFTVRDSLGNNVAGTVTYDGATRTATFRPSDLLAYRATYSAHVTGARDTEGNGITAYSWAFTTIHSPISVVSVSPPDLSTEQQPTTLISAVFSDDMDDWTVISGFSVKDFSNNAVQGVVTYDALTRTATFRPINGLNANGNLYIVKLSGMVGTHSGVMPDYTWKFRTLWRKPTVISTSPAQGSSGVNSSSVITVTFSEDMDPDSVRAGFKLKDNMNNNVAGGIVTDGRTSTFTPAAPLDEGELYAVYLLDLTGLQQNAMPDYVFEFTVLHRMTIPTSDPGPTARPSLHPTPAPFQTTIKGLSVNVNGDRITAPAGVDISAFLTNGHVSIPAGSGTLTVDITVGSPKNTGTITGVHVSDEATGTSNSGPATISVTADLNGLPSSSVSFSATVSDPTPEDISAAREWTGSRSRSLVNALALIDVQKSGFTNDDIVGGTAKITLTVKKPADFSRTKTYTVIRHGDNGYEELTATYKSETAGTVTFEIVSPNGFSTFLLAETGVAATLTPTIKPTPVPSPSALLISLAIITGVLLGVRKRRNG